MKIKPNESGAIRLLHIYGQGAWHDNIEIVGNYEALAGLADAITRALLVDRNAEMEAFVSDGEGYSVRVLLHDEEWKEWEAMPVPYTDEVAKERRGYDELKGPYQIWDHNAALNWKEDAIWWQRLLKKMIRLLLR